MAKVKEVEFRAPYRWYTWTGNASSNPVVPPAKTGLHYAYGNQNLLVSKGHPYQQLGRGSGNIGGPFVVVRRELWESNSAIGRYRTLTNPAAPTADNYEGSFFAFEPQVTDSTFPSIALSTSFELNAAGTTGIARSIPTNPLAGLATTLGELRSEGLPSLILSRTWRERLLNCRNAGHEYLNVEFGWKPLLNEIQTLAHIIRNADELSKRYEKESGKLLHRGYTFPVESTTSLTVTSDWPKPTNYTTLWQVKGERTLVTTIEEVKWFEGAFTYYLPPQGSVARQVAIADKLLGARITPEVLWNLTPWSWAVDWFTNVGDVIHNVSRFMNDGLVMHYGYIMRKRSVTREYSHSGGVVRVANGTKPIGILTQKFKTTVKERASATPWGFGLTFGSFTNRQKAIMAALGLTRGSTGMKYE